MGALNGVLLVIVMLASWGVVRPRLHLPGRFGRASHGGTTQTTPFVPVVDVATLGRLLARSHDAPVVLFLHDQGCPISRAAYRAIARLGGEITLVDVQRAHDLSRAVEARTGVRHESPQVIVLRQGQAAWSASHYAITARAVAQALQAV